MKKIKYTFKQYKEDIELLENFCRENSIDRIVSIYRGSLVMGVHLSNKLNIPLDIIKFQTYDGVDKEPITLISSIQKNENILIVDDICDTGNTFDKVYSYLVPNFPQNKFFFFSIFGKNPKYRFIRPASSWIDFWWEF